MLDILACIYFLRLLVGVRTFLTIIGDLCHQRLESHKKIDGDPPLSFQNVEHGRWLRHQTKFKMVQHYLNSSDVAYFSVSPFELDSGPVCRPEIMGGKSFRYYLFKFSLNLCSVGICDLAKAFGNPFSADHHDYANK